jgi:hypothetical protein
MCGCPRFMLQAASERRRHVIGCGHVSGLVVRCSEPPLAVMEIRGSGADQLDELFALGASVLFLVPIRPIICP